MCITRRYFFCNSGAEGVENAIKVARAATGRQNIISFFNGYHGRTNATMALTTSKTVYRVGFGPFMPGVHIAPYPACLHCKVRRRGACKHAWLPPSALPFVLYHGSTWPAVQRLPF